MLKIVAIALILLGAFFAVRFLKDNPEAIQSGFVNKSSREPLEISEEILFVPYWALDSEKSASEYDTLVYFGVAADENGIIRDPGYENTNSFLDKTSASQKKLLTLRLVDHDINSKILDSKNSQQRIVREIIEIAKEKEFDGIVIDFETKSIGFEEITQKTTDFLTSSSLEIKENGLESHVLLFGDTYYRARAFDVKKISEAADSIMIMTYDFHKSGGNPGPSFPTEGKDEYGYDLSTMLNDFAKDADPGKTTIIIGMFGYDWEVDRDGNSASQAVPITAGEAEMTFGSGCNYKDCIVRFDDVGQMTASYTDEEGNLHQVWSETDASKDEKVKIIQENGISNVGYWAHSFF